MSLTTSTSRGKNIFVMMMMMMIYVGKYLENNYYYFYLFHTFTCIHFVLLTQHNKIKNLRKPVCVNNKSDLCFFTIDNFRISVKNALKATIDTNYKHKGKSNTYIKIDERFVSAPNLTRVVYHVCR